MFGKKKLKVLVTDEDLVVPDLVTAGSTQFTPMAWPPDAELNGERIEVVGESFRQEVLDQIGQITKGATFMIWLCPEPQNKYDEYAVRVMAGRHHLGYIAKEESKLWSKRALPLWLEHRFLTGEGWGVDDDPEWKSKRGVRAKIWFANEGNHRKPKKGGLDTGWSAALLNDEADDDYSLSALTSINPDPLKRLKRLRELAATDSDLICLHFVLVELEEMLYYYREEVPGALEEFDQYAEKHHDLLQSQLRDLMISKFEAMPRVPVYRQAAIRHEKAGDLTRALEWTKRGLTIYSGQVSLANSAEKDFQDLTKRESKLEAKLSRSSK